MAVLAGAVAALIVSLRPASPTEFETATESHLAVSLTPIGKLTQPVVVKKNKWSVIADWEVETEFDWPHYKQWVTRQRSMKYKEVSDSDQEIVFRWVSHAEVLELRFTKIPESSPLAVKAEFIGSPW